jgi:PHS family inorganic phosphate transporter-like MFS transporter
MALAEVDKAPFGWYHVRLIVVTGIGFFTDAYSVSLWHRTYTVPLCSLDTVVRYQSGINNVGYSVLAR